MEERGEQVSEESSESVDIEITIEAYTFYVGFTGYMNDKNMELNLWEIFVFEENFDISKI